LTGECTLKITGIIGTWPAPCPPGV